MSMDYSGTPGEYIYSHNATGKSASGIIANGSTSERDLGAQRSAGGADRQAGDQGGHLIADRFGGRTTQQILMRRRECQSEGSS